MQTGRDKMTVKEDRTAENAFIHSFSERLHP